MQVDIGLSGSLLLVDMLPARQSEVKAETVGDTLANEEAYHLSIFWLKSQHKSSLRHKAT